jgi:hypothetical protein
MEIKDYTKAAFFAVTDPSLITVDFNQLAQKQKEIIKARDEQPVKSEGPAEELRKLRRELFVLTERAKSTETYCNNKAAEVRLLEEQLTDAINKKKAAVAKGNALAERACEHTITRLEDDIATVKQDFHRARKVSADSARVLKEWPHCERVKELEKVLGAENDDRVLIKQPKR